jgi:hypothetical protein
LKKLLNHLLKNNAAGRFLLNRYFFFRFGNSGSYWEHRYNHHGHSGVGSYGKYAEYKAAFLNSFVAEYQVESVIELGCGDGNQLKLFQFPFYTGMDVSAAAIKKCKALFKEDASKSFYTMAEKNRLVKADMAISLDVLYHLIEDKVYEEYLYELFFSARRFAVIYAWDVEGEQQLHVRHRKFSVWIEKNISGWHLKQYKASNAFMGSCEFFVYEKN